MKGKVCCGKGWQHLCFVYKQPVNLLSRWITAVLNWRSAKNVFASRSNGESLIWEFAYKSKSCLESESKSINQPTAKEVTEKSRNGAQANHSNVPEAVLHPGARFLLHPPTRRRQTWTIYSVSRNTPIQSAWTTVLILYMNVLRAKEME